MLSLCVCVGVGVGGGENNMYCNNFSMTNSSESNPPSSCPNTRYRVTLLIIKIPMLFPQF